MAAAVGDAAARAGLPIPMSDARLFQACADLAEIAPEDAREGRRMLFITELFTARARAPAAP